MTDTLTPEKREDCEAGLTSDIGRWLESHDLFDVPDGATYHTAANIIATDLMRCVVGPALDAAIERAEKAEESIAKNGGAGILLSRLAEAQAQRDALKARVAELEEIIKDVLGNVAKRLDAALKENSHDKG